MIPVGAFTANGRSKSLNAARLVNLYPEFPVPDSRSKVILRSTPGLEEWVTVGTGPIRGVHVMAGLLFAVSGTNLYSIASDGTATLRGSAGTIAGTGPVSMASNFAGELVITNSSGTGWIWNGSTLQALSSVDADFTDDATNVTFVDQYILYGKKNTGQVFASDLNDATSWSALSFASAEADEDNVSFVYGFSGYVWVFGDKTTEVWYNAATSPFAFARIQGAVMNDIGGVANTVADIDNTLYWRAPNGNVYRARGLQPERISTHEVEFNIKGWTNHYAFAYMDEGHAFYVLGADEGCYVFDATTNLWHERETFTVGRWRAQNYVNIYGKHLVGDYLIGRIYEMSLENYADGANSLQRKVVSPPIEANGEWVAFSHLQVHFEHGVGISGPPATEFYLEQALDEDGLPLLDESGQPILLELSRLTDPQGSDPQVVLRWSDDGGNTWSNEHWGATGKIGEYEKRTYWNAMGSARKRVYELTYTDPTKFAIYGADLR